MTSDRDANFRQVGGSHYKTKHGLEHWDIVNLFGLDYFQGQITKYVMRWRAKGGLQDLEKARHFLDKYIEVEQTKAGSNQSTRTETTIGDTRQAMPSSYDRSQDSNEYWQNEGYYGDGTCLYSCQKCKHQERAKLPPGVPHGCGPVGALEPSDAPQ